MAHRIRLARYAVENIQWLYFGAYRMRVEATEVEGDGLDKYNFIYQRGTMNQYLGQYCDEFVAIAGPSQIADIPIGEPDPERYYPYYRLDYMECDFTAESLALEVWEVIQREAAILCQGMARFQQLSAVEDVWVPSAPESSDSESASTSVV